MNRKVEKLLQKAIAAHQAGDYAAAELGYKKVLRIDPGNINGLYLLGTLHYHRAGYVEAERYLRKALDREPGFAQAWNNLGLVLHASDRRDDAVEAFGRALDLNPRLAEAHNSLGHVREEQGDLEGALAAFERAVAEAPAVADYQVNLAGILGRLGRLEDAERAYRMALGIRARDRRASQGLGMLLFDADRFDEAEPLLREVVHMGGDTRDARLALAACLRTMWRTEEAEEHLVPLCDDPLYAAKALFNLALCRIEQGELHRAVRLLKRSLAAQPDSHEVACNYLLFLNYLPVVDEQFVHAEHLRLAPRCDAPKTMPLVRSPGERLRVGYLSSDLRSHSVGYFIAPVIAQHDRDRFEVTCIFTGTSRPDDPLEATLRHSADRWIDAAGLPPGELADRVRAAGLDILVELNGYTGDNALLSVAARCAPVQVSYLGYPNTTGVGTVDFRITDRHADPAGRADDWHSERLLRLPRSFLTYAPHATAPEPDGSRSGAGAVFGSFNNLAKINRRVVALWARLLQQMPDARLLLKAFSLHDAHNVRSLRAQFAGHGIDPDRLELLAATNSVEEHLALYNRVDVALDTFPYNGTTTTCEALWMGVPVITLAGDRHRARVGVSILANVGLEGCVAGDEEEYIALARDAAQRVRAEPGARRATREAMAASALLDHRGVTRDLEQAYLEAVALRRSSGAEMASPRGVEPLSPP